MFHPDTLWINGEGSLSPFSVPPNLPFHQVCSKQPFVLNRGDKFLSAELVYVCELCGPKRKGRQHDLWS